MRSGSLSCCSSHAVSAYASAAHKNHYGCIRDDRSLRCHFFIVQGVALCKCMFQWGREAVLISEMRGEVQDACNDCSSRYTAASMTCSPPHSPFPRCSVLQRSTTCRLQHAACLRSHSPLLSYIAIGSLSR